MATATQFSIGFDPGFTAGALPRGLRFDGAGGAAIPTTPAISVVTPGVGTIIAAGTPLVVDATDTTALSGVLVLVLVGSVYEVAHDGTSFATNYSGSTRAEVEGGYRFTLLRSEGWTSAPSIRVTAANISGGSITWTASWSLPSGIDTTPPTAILAQSPGDARRAWVHFSEPVVEAEALVAANYSITPSLAVTSVAKITDSVYELTTDRQVPETVYNVTATGIHDLAGNLI